MRVCDIVSIAVDEAGSVFVATSDGAVGVLENDRLRPLDEGPSDARAVALAPRIGGGAFVADGAACRLLSVSAQGSWDHVAGAPHTPAEELGPSAADGTLGDRRLPVPSTLAAAGAAVVWFDASGARVSLVDDGNVASSVLGAPFDGPVTTAAGRADGEVAFAAASVPCLFVRSPDGRIATLAGHADEPGATDGRGPGARFARITSIAATANGLVVLDGGRLRRVDPRGRVTTIETVPFLGATAVGVATDGQVFVADVERGALRAVEPSGRLRTLVRDGTRRISDDEARPLARELTAALVNDDAIRGWSVAERLLAEHALRGRRRPQRALHPVSTASARVGRELALVWSMSAEPARARLGAYCLWLVRSEECRDAPASDATLLVDAIAVTFADNRLDDARRRVDVVSIAFGSLARRRDRLAVAQAYRATSVARLAADRLASRERAVRALAVDLLAQSRDIRFTGSLAAIALEGGSGGEQALRALHELWSCPAYDADQAAALRESLRFGRSIVDRLFAEQGDEVFGRAGAARYRRVLTGD